MRKMKFNLSGAVANEEVLELKQFSVESQIQENMRQIGFIPNLSAVPEVKTRQNKSGTLNYTITMEGVHIGQNHREFEGWLEDIGLISATPNAKYAMY